VKKVSNVELELMTLKELKKEQQWCACITTSRKYKNWPQNLGVSCFKSIHHCRTNIQ
jgi:hypothetical protein